MPNRMEPHYFEEKKALAIEGVARANSTATEVLGLLSSWSYEVPNIIDPSEGTSKFESQRHSLTAFVVTSKRSDGHQLKLI